MAITLNSIKCPECGAMLPIEEGRTQVFCTYCSAKVIITNENEHIYRHIDEAGIKQAETNRMVRMRELDLAEKNNSNKGLRIQNTSIPNLQRQISCGTATRESRQQRCGSKRNFPPGLKKSSRPFTASAILITATVSTSGISSGDARNGTGQRKI